MLRGVDFGPIRTTSGALNFFGEGYQYPWYIRAMSLGRDSTKTLQERVTFVAKTTTLEPRAGNMPLDGNLQPRAKRPDCIFANFRSFRHAAMINAVGLSGPGLEALLETGKWQQRQRPFFLSFMAIGKTAMERLQETWGFASRLRRFLLEFSSSVGLQVNVSCPNVGLHHEGQEFVTEVYRMLGMLGELQIPIEVKFSVLTPISVIKQIADHPACDGVCVSNTVNWNDLPALGIDPSEIFGCSESPLAKYGGGGLSGGPMLAHTERSIYDLRSVGVTKPISGENGIMVPNDVDRLVSVGATSVGIGSVNIQRRWRVPAIIDRAYELLG
jgi:dihydroorotate dehydrogenase